MREDWKFDRESLIDSCLNHELIDEIGLDVLREVVTVELRKVKRAPHIATYVHLIDGEPVYLRLIGKGWANGRLRPALLLAYGLYKRRIEPLWTFKASDEAMSADDGELAWDSGPLAPRSLEEAPRAKPHSDAPLSEPLERELERVVRNARRRRES
jgi:hypothetical protein